MDIQEPAFPPLLTGKIADGGLPPFETACEGARKGELGAGDVIWMPDAYLARSAVVLEPEVPLEAAVQMIPLAMVAASDCLGVLTPPQVAVTFQWPGLVRVNGGEAGRIRAAAGTVIAPQDIPDWLVIGFDFCLANPPGDSEPGDRPELTSLEEEGCSGLTGPAFLESLYRHLLTWLNTWEHDGFKPVQDAWLFRAEGIGETVDVPLDGEIIQGIFTGLDENGNFLLKDSTGGIRTLPLHDALEVRNDQTVSRWTRVSDTTS